MTGGHRTPEPPRTHSRGAWWALLILGALVRTVDNRRYNWMIVVIGAVLLAGAVVLGITKL